jgi:hypothetical protein
VEKSESQGLQLNRLKKQRAESDIAMVLLQDPGAQGKAISFKFSDRDTEESAETAKAGSRAGFDTICLSEPDKAVLISLASSQDAKVRDEKVLFIALNSLVASLGGRGGGGKGNFRATFPTLEAAEDSFRQATTGVSKLSGLSGLTQG